MQAFLLISGFWHNIQYSVYQRRAVWTVYESVWKLPVRQISALRGRRSYLRLPQCNQGCSSGFSPGTTLKGICTTGGTPALNRLILSSSLCASWSLLRRPTKPNSWCWMQNQSSSAYNHYSGLCDWNSITGEISRNPNWWFSSPYAWHSAMCI